MALKIERNHALDETGAKEAAEKFVHHAQKDEYMNKYVKLEWNWSNPGKEIALLLTGRVKITGKMKLERGRVVIELDIPLLARPFSGTIKERIEQGLIKTFV